MKYGQRPANKAKDVFLIKAQLAVFALGCLIALVLFVVYEVMG
tara:strand:- start:779 stop:907 length:129 start_codon:yes stop_codon:yes gene_type:complete